MLVDDGLLARATAGGTPSHLADPVPPTIQPLLAGTPRPARRPRNERGRTRRRRGTGLRGAVTSLAPADYARSPAAYSLVRKDLIRPESPSLADEGVFRFRHILIRDAAYEAAAEATAGGPPRALRRWLDRRGRRSGR